MTNNLKKIILNDTPKEALLAKILSAKVIIFLINADTLRKLIREGHKIKDIYKKALESGKKVVLFESPYNIRIDVEKEIITFLKNINEDVKDAIVIIFEKTNH